MVEEDLILLEDQNQYTQADTSLESTYQIPVDDITLQLHTVRDLDTLRKCYERGYISDSYFKGYLKKITVFYLKFLIFQLQNQYLYHHGQIGLLRCFSP